MDTTPPPGSAGRSQASKAFYDAIWQRNMTPLWEVLHALVPTQPATPCRPALWRYGEERPYMMELDEPITC